MKKKTCAKECSRSGMTNMNGHSFSRFQFSDHYTVGFDWSICRCQKRSHTDTTHLIIRNLDEFDVGYLRALISNNLPVILRHENAAKGQGFGPLRPCGYRMSPSGQKQLCRMFSWILRLSFELSLFFSILASLP